MAPSRSIALALRFATVSLLTLVASSSQAQGRFVVSADGQSVLDSTTQLIWRRCVEGLRWDGKACAGKLAKFSYAGAKQQSAAAVPSDGNTWRIPTRDELLALVDKSAKKKPKIDAVAFPNTPNAMFWASRPGSDDDLNAWLVNFGNGKVIGNAGEAKFPLRLVRAGA